MIIRILNLYTSSTTVAAFSAFRLQIVVVVVNVLAARMRSDSMIRRWVLQAFSIQLLVVLTACTADVRHVPPTTNAIEDAIRFSCVAHKLPMRYPCVTHMLSMHYPCVSHALQRK
eukprot:SAG11_NODE_2866_length_2890_cov_4.515944_1_plen_115_part_00